MRQKYTVEVESGEVSQVTVDQRDIRKWESQWDLSWLAAPTSYTQIAQLVYLAGTRTSNTFKSSYPSYEDFDKVCVVIRAVEDDAATIELAGHPTPPEATDDSSVS